MTTKNMRERILNKFMDTVSDKTELAYTISELKRQVPLYTDPIEKGYLMSLKRTIKVLEEYQKERYG